MKAKLNPLKALWLWGRLTTYPGDDPGPYIDDETFRRYLKAWPSLDDERFWAGQQWIRRLMRVELHWRLVKALVAGALIGMWLALR